MRDHASTSSSRACRYTIIIAVGVDRPRRPAGASARSAGSRRNPIAYGVSGFYTSFFRGTPLIVQMFLIYVRAAADRAAILAFRQLGRGRSSPSTRSSAGIVALGLNYGAYMTEIFRAGIQSVSHGQSEAAEALGMTYRQKMKRVVLPQAFRVIIPPTGNEFIAMMKDTALVSFLGVVGRQAEIFRRAQLVGQRGLPPAGGVPRWPRCCTGPSRRSSRSSRAGSSAGSARATSAAARRRPKSTKICSSGGVAGTARAGDLPDGRRRRADRRTRAAGAGTLTAHATERPSSGSRTCTRASATSRCSRASTWRSTRARSSSSSAGRGRARAPCCAA